MNLDIRRDLAILKNPLASFSQVVSGVHRAMFSNKKSRSGFCLLHRTWHCTWHDISYSRLLKSIVWRTFHVFQTRGVLIDARFLHLDRTLAKFAKSFDGFGFLLSLETRYISVRLYLLKKLLDGATCPTSSSLVPS